MNFTMMKSSVVALFSLAAVVAFCAPASAQWRNYNGYQANPPNYTYPPYPGGGQPQNYGEPQAEPPDSYVPPDQRAYASPTPHVSPDTAPYNPPPDDDAAAVGKHTRQEVDYPLSLIHI